MDTHAHKHSPTARPWLTAGQLAIAVAVGALIPWIVDLGFTARLALMSDESLKAPAFLASWAPDTYTATEHSYELLPLHSGLNAIESGSDRNGDGRIDLWYAGIGEGIGPFARYIVSDTTGNGQGDSYCISAGETPAMIGEASVLFAYEKSSRGDDRLSRVQLGSFQDPLHWSLYHDFNSDNIIDLMERYEDTVTYFVFDDERVVEASLRISERHYRVGDSQAGFVDVVWVEDAWEWTDLGGRAP